MRQMQIQSLPKEYEYLGPATDFLDDIQEIFCRAPLLEVLDVTETMVLCNFMACCSVARGVALLRQGSLNDFMLFLLTGRVDLSVRDVTGRKRSLAMLGPGASIGEMTMIDGSPCGQTSVSVEPVDLVLMTRQGFKDILVTYPRLGNKLLLVLLHSMSQRLQGGRISG